MSKKEDEIWNNGFNSGAKNTFIACIIFFVIIISVNTILNISWDSEDCQRKSDNVCEYAECMEYKGVYVTKSTRIKCIEFILKMEEHKNGKRND